MLQLSRSSVEGDAGNGSMFLLLPAFLQLSDMACRALRLGGLQFGLCRFCRRRLGMGFQCLIGRIAGQLFSIPERNQQQHALADLASVDGIRQRLSFDGRLKQLNHLPLLLNRQGKETAAMHLPNGLI